MKFTHFLNLTFLLILTFSIAAQTSPTESKTEKDKAKEKLEKEARELVEEVINEADSLKLWENRALVLGIAGDLLWKSNQKRARKLFRESADELIRGNFAPKEKPKDYWEEYAWWRDVSPRRIILLTIAQNDADLALQLLQETRPPDLQTAIDAENQVKTAKPKTAAENIKEEKNSRLVQQEIALEQQFAVKAAEQDPKKAAKLIRESLSKGVSTAAIQLISKVSEKNEELGKELLNEVLRKLLDADFKQKTDTRRVAAYILHQSFSPHLFKAGNEKFKPIKLEDRDLKDIASKLADYFLESTEFNSFWEMSQAIQALNKYVPDKKEQLKQKMDAFEKMIPASDRGWMDVEKLISDPNTTAEKLISEAEKFTGYEKYELYRRAIDRSVEEGSGEKIQSLLQNSASSKQRDDALEYLSSKISAKAIKDDKLDEVGKLVGKTESTAGKVKLYVDFAVGFEKKKTEESHKTALALMEEARKLINHIPESGEELKDIIKVASGFAEVEPDKAFPYLEPMINMTNDLTTAYALLSKYNKSETFFKQGELLFTQSAGYGRDSFVSYGKQLGLLAAADFGRTKSLTERFNRNDVKILAKLFIVQAILKEKIGFEGGSFYYTEFAD